MCWVGSGNRHGQHQVHGIECCVQIEVMPESFFGTGGFEEARPGGGGDGAGGDGGGDGAGFLPPPSSVKPGIEYLENGMFWVSAMFCTL